MNMKWSFDKICLLFELGALGIVIYRRLVTGDRSLTIFVWLLLLTNVIEWGSLNKVFLIQHFKYSNNWIFNLFNPIEFGIYTSLYYSIMPGRKDRFAIVFLYFTYLVLSIINILFIQGLIFFDSYTFMFGCLLMVYCVSLYFKQIIRNPETTNIVRERFFWISVGLLFFYTGDFLLMAFFEYFKSINDFPTFAPVFHFFSNLLNILLYTCLSISFFCKLRLRVT